MISPGSVTPRGTDKLLALLPAKAVALGVPVTSQAAGVAPTPLPLIPETKLDATGIFLFHVSLVSVSIGSKAKTSSEQ